MNYWQAQFNYGVHIAAGCQPKTFKTFILMVKPLKPLFLSEKPLETFSFLRKTFIFRKSYFFSIQGAKIL